MVEVSRDGGAALRVSDRGGEVERAKLKMKVGKLTGLARFLWTTARHGTGTRLCVVLRLVK